MNERFLHDNTKYYVKRFSNSILEAHPHQVITPANFLHVQENTALPYRLEYIGAINPETMNTDELKSLLDMSFECSALFPNRYTYYVMDISTHSETEYNTLMFQLNEPPKKSIETTRKIMNRYFESNNFGYKSMKWFGSFLRNKNNMPYILGEKFFVPDGGTSKKSASWFGMHHITNYLFDSKTKQLQLYSRQELLLTFNMTKQTFEKKVHNVSHLYFIQVKLMGSFAKHFNLFPIGESSNIVHKYLEKHSHQLPNITIYDFFEDMVDLKTHEKLVNLLGEGNPYLDDLDKLFSFVDDPED